MLRLLKSSSYPESHEDLFVARFERLLGWAMQLAEGDRTQAEDLAQDAFIQFTALRPDLKAIRNLDGYLYEVLRNLHLSRIRRATRNRLQQLSIVEYDSAETGLLKLDPRDQLKARDELRAVCRYACARKETSKAGSVLILRFFHGYYPSEIIKIFRSTRQVVDFRLLVARREARLSLESPERLGFINEAGDATLPDLPSSSWGIDDLLSELRRLIFQSRRGDCLAREQLQQLYQRAEASPIACPQLAHIVSCPHCLDEVNRLLELPLLAERYPTDTLGPERESKGGRNNGEGGGSSGGGATGGAPNRSMRRYRRQARQDFEHRPQELHISVNGFILGSRRVNAEVNDLTLDINLTEPVNFIEAFSEQEIRLMLFKAGDPPPQGPVEQSARVELSDGRSFDLTLRFRHPWPTLYALYRDPLMRAEPLAEIEMAAEDGPASPIAQESFPGDQSQSMTRRERFTNFGAQFWRRFFNPQLWLRPGMVTTIIAAALIAALLLAPMRAPHSTVKAAELLRRSAAAEVATAARIDQVLHRTISLEERRGDCGLRIADCGLRVIARRRIEVWQSAERGLKTLRLYDEKNRLLAGEWRKADGSRTVYRRHGEVRRGGEGEDSIRNPQSAIRDQEVWRLEPSAETFSTLIGAADRAQVEESPLAYTIIYESDASGALRGLRRAILALSRADLRAIEQTLVIEQNGETREYRYREVSFERRPPSAVAPAVFDPDPELLKSDAATRRRGDTAIVPPSLPVATAELEIEALRLLNQAGADLGEQVNVVRAPEGQLQIQGIVDTEKRKSEILRALAPLMKNPALAVEVNTAAEALRKTPAAPVSPDAIKLQQIEPASDKIPVYAELHRYFSRRGAPEAAIEAEIANLADRTLGKSQQILMRAWALKRLAGRFSPDQLRALDRAARAEWRRMIGGHAEALRQRVESLRQELEPIFSPGQAADERQAEIEITGEQSLARAIESLFELCAAQEKAIRPAFAISSSSQTIGGVKTAEFWRSLRTAERLAAKIQKAVTSDE